ncbi:MAG: hypothetical protein ACXWUP_03490 [Allosphingosinicella sp.]
MGEQAQRSFGPAYLVEMTEFASFEKGAQRYIRRSLDIGLQRRDAVRRWARDAGEAAEIRSQARVYQRLAELRGRIPDDVTVDTMEPLMAPLIALTAFDLGSARLDGFTPYRFLYERLIGAAVRPWLTGAFCAAATMPHLHPQDRLLLLRSLPESAATAPGWSIREPVFFPEWVEKVDLAIA